jgi:class 3 adenylate cyclase
MKRKIAAIFAADIAGYSRLVAEDEEETLRRLASYRAVMDDFIARAGGRIFNTAGDAVLAEFSSAVEAVRCAIDIQESLRTRNMAYPASRQMNFRIGITVGDVVERDGDLLGDGVNIAARLEGLAPVGGICISRTVHEQVANKLSVQFADIGEQQVKNIPTPVHAFKIEMRPDDGSIAAAPVKGPAKGETKRASWIMPAGVAAAAAAVAIVAAAGAYVTLGHPDKAAGPSFASVPPGSESPAQPAPSPSANERNASDHKTANAAPPAQTLVPETIPLIADRARANIRNEYMPAPNHKALAISAGPIGFITGQADDETAKTAALDICQKRADAQAHRAQCELYGVGNTVVFAGGRPPMPPEPWFTRDPLVEKPFAADDVPLVKESGKAAIAQRYAGMHKPKVPVIGPRGGFHFYNQESLDEAARRALEACGGSAGVPCLIVAIDDTFVVPIPATMKVVGFFRAASAPTIAPGSRDDVAHRLANAGGWTAVAAGADGRAGVSVKAANEQAAIDGALADCGKQDRSCRVVAIGPFAVEPK